MCSSYIHALVTTEYHIFCTFLQWWPVFHVTTSLLLRQESVPALTVPMEGHVLSIFWECRSVCEFAFICVERGKENPISFVCLCMCVDPNQTTFA